MIMPPSTRSGTKSEGEKGRCSPSGADFDEGSCASNRAGLFNVCRSLFVQIPYESILLINQNYLRIYRHFAQVETHDDDFFTGLDKMRRRSIHANVSRAALAQDDIGFQSGP